MFWDFPKSKVSAKLETNLFFSISMSILLCVNILSNGGKRLRGKRLLGLKFTEKP